MMINEDLLSRRYKVMYDLTFKKSKKGKGKKKGKK
jgi:hypothetical protein